MNNSQLSEIFSESFYNKLNSNLEIEGSSIFEYFPKFFNSNDFNFSLAALKNSSMQFDKRYYQIVFEAYVYTILSIKIHLLDKLKEKNVYTEHYKEYAVLFGDLYGGEYIKVFAENEKYDELNYWFKQLAILDCNLINKSLEQDFDSIDVYICTYISKMFAYLLRLNIDVSRENTIQKDFISTRDFISCIQENIL